MLIDPSDLVHGLSDRGGEPFEAFLYDLLHLESRSEEIPPTDVIWDPRINVPDGGRDICVLKGAASTTSLIPQEPSIWSAKAGRDGINPATLENEVGNHDKIKAHIEEGKTYCYAVLQMCSQDQHEALIRKAAQLCNGMGIPESRIRIIFNEQLAQRVSKCPSLIPDHLRDLSRRLGSGATSASTWIEDNRQGGTEFASIPDREQVFEDIQQLLSGNSDQQYMHIAGWSGIGKSRLVAESIDRDELRTQLVVYQTYQEFDDGLLTSLKSGQVTAATVIVDEVDLKEVTALTDLCRRRPGLRLVSIGATEDSQRMPQACVFLSRPPDETLVQIITARCSNTLPDQAVARIADLADGDLRFAEMLTDAARSIGNDEEGPGAFIEALYDLATIVTRYFNQHQDTVGDVNIFCERLSVITLLAEVGARGERKGELSVLTECSGVTTPDMSRTIESSRRIGTCQWVGDYVECIPRPLATHLFERHAWPLIERDLLAFYKKLPNERSRRSFLRRIAYCSAERRKEVEGALGAMFWGEYGDARLSSLVDSDVAHTLRVLIEVMPQQGLTWLNKVIDSATIEELLQFPGSNFVLGPTYGRREIVWLCESLRCFADCFFLAEAILFRLALAETERIGNNATAEWKQCFWWRMSGTEVPLPNRIDVLLERLHKADEGEISLLLEGAVAALDDPTIASSPPDFVGGRATPAEWRPQIWGEIHEQWDRVLVVVIDLSERPEFRRQVISVVIGNLVLFVRRGIPEGLTSRLFNLDDLREDEVRALRKELDRLLGQHSRLAEEIKQDVASWKASLEPASLSEQLRDIVGRETWDHERNHEDPESWRYPYEQLATVLSQNPSVLEESRNWLASDQARSSRTLAAVIGQMPEAREALQETVISFLNEGTCREFVVGYFVGVSGDQRVLPDWASVFVDAAANGQPDLAVTITVESDVSRRGLTRLFSVLPSCETLPSTLLGRIYGKQWTETLEPEDKKQILDVLVSANSDDYALSCAFHLLTMWSHRRGPGIDEELDDVVGELVRAALSGRSDVRDSDWEEAMKWWSPRHPEIASKLLVDTMVSTERHRTGLSDEAENVLRELATSHPDSVADAIESSLANETKRTVFHILVFRGLFEPIGLARVQAIIDRHGDDAASAIARHLPDPDTDTESGRDLMEWFLSTYANNESVFISYMCGRHSGKARWGYAYQRRDEVYKQTEPYLDSTNPGIRRWAIMEREDIDREAECDRKRVEEMGRD